MSAGSVELQLICGLPVPVSVLMQNYDTELLLPRDAVCVPAQPVVVVKSESEPSAISFMGALRIPVSLLTLLLCWVCCHISQLSHALCFCREWWSFLSACSLPSWSVIPSFSGCPFTSPKQVGKQPASLVQQFPP